MPPHLNCILIDPNIIHVDVNINDFHHIDVNLNDKIYVDYHDRIFSHTFLPGTRRIAGRPGRMVSPTNVEIKRINKVSPIQYLK